MLNESLIVSELSNRNLTINEDKAVKINFDESGLLFFNISDAQNLDFDISIAENVNARIIYWNEGNNNIEVNEKYAVANDAYLNLIYGELSSGNLLRNTVVDLSRGSEVLVDGASVTSSNKSQTITANHNGTYTTSNLNSYGIVSEGGKFFLDVIGHIKEKAVGAKAHQDSKILTLSDKQSTKVIPRLLIYENDVEASHAATVGQIDENQMYYLQSRGLSEMESMALLMGGYLMPIASKIEDEELSEHVKELIASKVDEICSVSKE